MAVAAGVAAELGINVAVALSLNDPVAGGVTFGDDVGERRPHRVAARSRLQIRAKGKIAYHGGKVTVTSSEQF